MARHRGLHGLAASRVDRDLLAGAVGKDPAVRFGHVPIFRWLIARFPDTKLYGPYHHGGRSYFQWMARGPALVRDVLPWLEDAFSSTTIDEHAASRFALMCERYASFIARERSRLAESAVDEAK